MGRPARKSKGWLIGLAIGGVLVLGIGALAVLVADEGSTPTAASRSTSSRSTSSTSSPSTSSTSKPSTSPSGSTSSAAAKVTRKPGYITGIVLDQRGAPLKVSSDQIRVRVSGHRSDMAEVSAFIPVQADGRFELKVPEGTYSLSGNLGISFQGEAFRLALEPVGGQGPDDSKAGIAKEMRLKLTGLKPGMDPNNPYSYYGGHVRLQDRVMNLPNDAKVTFTLTPTTPLVDGSQGKPLTFHTTGKELKGLAVEFKDIPLAKYRMTGAVTMPDGSKKTALLRSADTEPATALEFSFHPRSTEGINAAFLYMEGVR